MIIIHSEKPDAGIRSLSIRISGLLNNGKRVTWLIAGGSNIPIAKVVMDDIRKNISVEKLTLLTVSQTDERFGPVGHPDSNWKQMIDAGFDFTGTTAIPILRNVPLEKTCKAFAVEIIPALDASDAIIAQFGFGADGHIAGIIPHSEGVAATDPVVGYNAQLFVRISLSFSVLKRIHCAYVFVFGESKRHAIEDLQNKNLPLNEEPAQIVKQIPESYIYTDVDSQK